MSNFKVFNPSDIDESLVKLIEFEGRHHVLLSFIDATGEMPEIRSLGHVTAQPSVRLKDLEALTAAMRNRAQGTAIWYLLFNTPWLLRQSDGDAIQKAKSGRR